MNRFNSIFGQILQMFSRSEFYKAEIKTGTERGAKGFTCWQQFVAMLFYGLGQADLVRLRKDFYDFRLFWTAMSSNRI